MKKKKFKHAHRPQPKPAPQEPVSKAQLLNTLDLGLLDAAPVTLPDWQMVQIVVVGVGGIGAYVTQHIGRLMRVIYQNVKGAHLTVVDPDVVEDVNIGRQLFCDAELGQPKAEAIARRYGHAWGLNCSSYVGKFDETLLMGAPLTLLIGCVDNAAARRDLHKALENNPEEGLPTIWWIDCGNLRDTGAVMIGSACEVSQLAGAFSEPKHCIALPSPALQCPALLEPTPEETGGEGMSCAQLAAANMQSLNINALVAVQAADFATRLLVTKDLKRFAWEGSLAAGSGRSKYTTAEAVAEVIHRPVSFLREAPETIWDDPASVPHNPNFDEMIMRAAAQRGGDAPTGAAIEEIRDLGRALGLPDELVEQEIAGTMRDMGMQR